VAARFHRTALAAGAWTCPEVFAAQKSPIARIGLLAVGSLPIECCATPECNSDRRDNYVNPINCWLSVDLNALGWREGENLQIAARSGDPASLPRLAAELVALRPDVLIAVGSTEAKALQAATSDIPIFFQVSTDPVGYERAALHLRRPHRRSGITRQDSPNDM